MDPANPWVTITVLIVLTTVIGVGIWMMMRMREAARSDGGPMVKEKDLLDPLQAAYRSGQMDTAEFERIRSRLGDPMAMGRTARLDASASSPAEGAIVPRSEIIEGVKDPSSSAEHRERD